MEFKKPRYNEIQCKEESVPSFSINGKCDHLYITLNVKNDIPVLINKEGVRDGTLRNRTQLQIWTTVLIICVVTLILICDMKQLNFFSNQHQSYNFHHHQKEILDPSQVRVVVYYEALCPDSRDFVVRELEPTYKKIHEIIALDLVPYGKATSKIDASGVKSFQCQHGPVECRANTVHSCVYKHIKDKLKSLDVITCMIEINHRVEPIEAGEKCMMKSSLMDMWPVIKECSTGVEGKDILYQMGDVTHELGKVSFIPTISLNGSTDKQNVILRNFMEVVCDAYSGPTVPVACKRL